MTVITVGSDEYWHLVHTGYIYVHRNRAYARISDVPDEATGSTYEPVSVIDVDIPRIRKRKGLHIWL